jgi:Mg2+ and Co2+ transporter CorA
LVVGLRQRCDIDVVDFSEDDLSLHYLDNDSLGDFLAEPRPEWGKVLLDQCQRPQLDVLRLLGNHKNLHPLAIESVLSPENRTKAEW